MVDGASLHYRPTAALISALGGRLKFQKNWSGRLDYLRCSRNGGGHIDWRSPSGFFAFPRHPPSSKLDASSSKNKTSAMRRLRQSMCRDDWIRTSDPLHPMQVRYRAALRPENTRKRTWSPFGTYSLELHGNCTVPGGAKVKENSFIREKNQGFLPPIPFCLIFLLFLGIGSILAFYLASS